MDPGALLAEPERDAQVAQVVLQRLDDLLGALHVARELARVVDLPGRRLVGHRLRFDQQ